MWTARTVAEGMAAFSEVEPSFNWVFADSAGDIGYQMSGLMPQRADDWSGFAPRAGWDERFDWKGFVSAQELPRVHNPADGIIVTATRISTTSAARAPSMRRWVTTAHGVSGSCWRSETITT